MKKWMMAMDDKKWGRLQQLLLYGVPLTVYGVLAMKLGSLHRDLLNADAVNYIQRTRYLLHGDFYHFISEHWSLMISWLMAPLQAVGIDGLYAARIVTGLIGAAYLIVFIKLSERLLRVHWMWRMFCGVALAPFLAITAIRVITPDQLLATCLAVYFIIVLDPGLAKSRRRQFAAGIVGGFAYLAKAFAFPFVIVHLLVTLAMHVRKNDSETQNNRGLIRQVLPAYAIGLLGFLLIAGPWIAAISWKYGHLSIGSSGAAAHGVTYRDKPEGRELTDLKMGETKNIIVPPDPYIAPFETPEKLFPRWSPFASRENFKYQMRIVGLHAFALYEYLSSSTELNLFVVFGVLSILLLPIRSEQRWKIVWLLLTLGLFLGPFLLVVIQHRYLNPHVVPLLVLLCMIVALEWRPGKVGADASGIARVRWWRACIGAVVLGAFFWGTIVWLGPMWTRPGPRIYRQLAQKISSEKLEGPFASDSGYRGVMICLHTGHKLIGFSPADDPDYVEERLREIGVRYLLVWDARRGFEGVSCGPQIVEHPGWREIFHYHGARGYQYSKEAAAATRPTTSRAATTRRTARPGPGENLVPEDVEDPDAMPRPAKKKPPRGSSDPSKGRKGR